MFVNVKKFTIARKIVKKKTLAFMKEIVKKLKMKKKQKNCNQDLIVLMEKLGLKIQEILAI